MSAPVDTVLPARAVLPGLDTVRALGALLVLTTHVAFWSGGYSFGLLGTALSRMDVGVAIFFVLSGYLLARPYLECAARGLPAPATAPFLWNRAVRILPVFWVTAVIALLVVDENHGAGVTAWLRALTLSDIYFADHLTPGLTQMWSLATEVAFYLTLPLWMRLWVRATRGPHGARGVVTLVLGSAALSLIWVAHPPAVLVHHTPLHLQWLPTYLVWFFVGIGLSHLHADRATVQADGIAQRLLDRIAGLGSQPGVCLTMALAGFAIASTPIAGPPLLSPSTSGQLVTKIVLYAVIGGLIVLPAASAETGRFARVVSHPVGRHLGHVSYPLFCVHLVVLELIDQLTPWEPFTGGSWTIFAVTLLVSLALAELLHRFVEVPCLRLRRRSTSSSSAKGSRASAPMTST